MFSRINAALYSKTLSGAHVFAQRAYLRSLRAMKERREFDTYFGARMCGNIGDYVQARIFSFGIWEPNLSRFMESKIGPETVAVDVGSHVGYFTLLMSKLAKKVIAIEPSPSNFEQLSRHVAMNGRSNVTLLNQAVAQSRGEMKLFNSVWGAGNTGNMSLIEPANSSGYTTVQTDTLLGALGDDAANVSFIKIDIEAAERPVLEEIIANREKFAKRLTIVSEVNDGNLDLVDRFLSAGFRCSVLDNSYNFEAYLSGRTEAPQPWNGVRHPSADLIFERE